MKFIEDYKTTRAARENWEVNDIRHKNKEALDILLLASFVLESNRGTRKTV